MPHAAAAKLGINWQTVTDWIQTDPDFHDAYQKVLLWLHHNVPHMLAFMTLTKNTAAASLWIQHAPQPDLPDLDTMSAEDFEREAKHRLTELANALGATITFPDRTDANPERTPV